MVFDDLIKKAGLIHTTADQGNPPLISPLLHRKVLEYLWPLVRNNNNHMQNPNVKMASVKK